MGKIKKISENELVGGTQRIDIYPVTSTKAVYGENNNRLDNILNNLKNGIDNCVTLTSEQNITAAKTFSGGISMSNTLIKDVKEPTNSTDAANKSYIDSKVADIPVEKGTGEGSIIQKGSQDYPAIASGRISSAFGMNTKSIGNYSFSEGEDTQALGEHSHVEGFSTIASGSESHAEGTYTRASGGTSHAEGESTTASGYASHAEGNSTNANGNNSHSEGTDTITSNTGEHAEGNYNVSHTGTLTADKTIHSVGIGTSDSERKNAVEVMQNGDVYVLDVGGYDGANLEKEGVKSIQTVVNEVNEKIDDSPIVKGEAGNSAIQSSRTGAENKAISENSVALGSLNIAGLKGWYYKAIQFNKSTNVTFLYLSKTQQVPVIVTSASNVEQEKDIDFPLKGKDIVSVVNANKYDNKYLISTNEIVTYGRIGIRSVDSNTPFPFDKINTNEELSNGIFEPEDYSIYCLSKPNDGIVDIGQDSFVSGYNNKATNGKATAFGFNNNAYGKCSFVEGRDNEAGYAAHAEGRENVASGDYSHAEGYKTKANSKYGSHAEGYHATASGDCSHAEGRDTTALGNYSHAEGYGTIANGDDSHAEGIGTVTLNTNEHAEGKYNISNTGISDADTTIHSIGVGTSYNDRKNAVEVMRNGDVYIVGVGNYQGTSISSATPLANCINSIQSDLSNLSSDYDMYKDSIQLQMSDLTSLAKGAQRALVYADYSKLVTALNAGMVGIDVLPKGQSIYIQQLNVPDLWVSNFRAPDELTEYTYTNDDDFLEYIKGGGWIGCHQLSLLETAKVDLSNTASKTEVTALQAEVAALKAIINEITTKE